jgi:hypothetical protein
MRGSKKAQRRTVWLSTNRRLKRTKAGGYVLIGRGGPVQLNDMAASILALCDGRSTREEIIARVLLAHEAQLSAAIGAFLESAARRGWIEQRQAGIRSGRSPEEAG